MKVFKVRCELLEEMLGTSPTNTEIYEDYIASKAPEGQSVEDEIAALGVDEYVDKTMTAFRRTDDGKPCLFDYQIKGFFKEAAKNCKGDKANKSSKLAAYKSKIDGNVFVRPRMIELNFKGFPGNCQRPLRASTPQGERVALANSETVPAGTTFEFEILCMDTEKDKLSAMIEEWLDYGYFKGLGQWRNASKGRFDYEIVSEEEVNGGMREAKKWAKS